MPEEQKPFMEEGNNHDQSQEPASGQEKFLSDTQKIIHRHLEDPNDVITEEDIRNIRVGMTPKLDEATESRFEDESAREKAEEELLGREGEENINGKEGPITPWDTIDGED